MTDHVHNQLCARIEELEAEKMELNEQLDIAQRERDEAARDLAMEQEHHQATRRSEETLAAHVERCRDVFSGLSEYWNGCEGMAAENAAQNAMDVACDMLEELPETSLARLKARWQAEVLDEASNEFEVHERARMVLHWKAQKIRQQAEGGSMTDHDIEINAMDAARREIGAAIRRLDKAAGILEEYEHGGRLVVIAHCLREIDRELYEKIHPAATPKPETQP